MPIVKVGDQRIKFPDDMSQEDIGAVLQKQFSQPDPTPQQPAQQPVSEQDLYSDVPLPPEQIEQLTPEQQKQYFGTTEQKDRSLGEKLIGGAEAAAAATIGAVPALVGQTVGTAEGVLDYLSRGDFSKPPAELVSQRAMQGAQRLAPVPPSEAGREYLQNVGEAAAPLAAVTPMAGELSALASAASKAPMAIAKIRQIPKTIAARKMLQEAAPSVAKIKQTARNIYSSLDDSGVVIAQPEIASLADDIARTTKRQGFNPRIHPKIAATLDEVAENSGKSMSLTELDTMRRVAGSAAKSIEPSEARLGAIIIDKIDDFMNKLPDEALVGGESKNVGALYGQARNLWQRTKKADLLADAVEKAKNQASGFENGLRTQFRSILNNKKKMRGFTKEERAALERVVQGGGAENMLKFLGKFGFTEGQATSMLGSAVGAGAGAAVAGPGGAVAVPMIGQMSKSLAQRLTRGNAAFADQVIRSGRDGKKIALAYVNNTPKSARSASELAELLMRDGVDIKSISKMSNPVIKDAAFIAEISRMLAAQSQAEEAQNATDEPVSGNQE